jgi:hypothetical protein
MHVCIQKHSIKLIIFSHMFPTYSPSITLGITITFLKYTTTIHILTVHVMIHITTCGIKLHLVPLIMIEWYITAIHGWQILGHGIGSMLDIDSANMYITCIWCITWKITLSFFTDIKNWINDNECMHKMATTHNYQYLGGLHLPLIFIGSYMCAFRTFDHVCGHSLVDWLVIF